MERIGVMQIVDTLTVGGAERVAVNLANLLPPAHFRSSICATRTSGVLRDLVSPEVPVLLLNRSGRFDLSALRRLTRYIRENNVRILHAHASALFFARIAGWLTGVPVVWHDHFGRYQTEQRPRSIYGPFTAGIGGVISVNEPLAKWARETLHVPADRVRYIPNLVELGAGATAKPLDLPGAPGRRIVCVANFRPQKDHKNLLRAMEKVVKAVPDAVCMLAGEATVPEYRAEILAGIERMGLQRNVISLDERTDVPDILRACDIGVLSSESEGLPLSLLEYGAAGLACVSTAVGQCGDVLSGGEAGLLVPPSDPEALGQALIDLLQSPSLRSHYGARLYERIEETYSPRPILRQICDVYRRVLPEDRHNPLSHWEEELKPIAK